MKILKSILFYIVGLFVIAITVWGGMNLTGFCWSQGRYLSDQEIFRNMIVDRFVGTNFFPVNAVKRRVGNDDIEEVVKYNSYEEFINKNPDCCKYFKHYSEVPEVVSNGEGILTPPFFYKLFGCYFGNVAISLKIIFKTAKKSENYLPYQSSTWVDSCGNDVKIPLKYIIGNHSFNGDINHG